MRRVVLVLFTFGVLASSLPASAQSGSTSVRHRDPAGDVRTHESNAYFQRGIDDHDIHEVTATWNPDGSVDASMTVANFTSPAAIAYGETATNWWGLVPTTRLHLRSLKSLDDDRWPAVEASVLFGGVDRRSVRMWPQTSGCDPTWSFSGDTFSIHLPGACVEGVDTLWVTGHTSGRYGTIGGSFEMTDLAEAGPIVRRAGQTPTERNSHLPPGFGEGEPEPRWQADNDSRSEKAAFVDPDDDVEIDREQSQESQQRSGFLDVRQVTVTQVDGVPTVTVTGEPGFLDAPNDYEPRRSAAEGMVLVTLRDTTTGRSLFVSHDRLQQYDPRTGEDLPPFPPTATSTLLLDPHRVAEPGHELACGASAEPSASAVVLRLDPWCAGGFRFDRVSVTVSFDADGFAFRPVAVDEVHGRTSMRFPAATPPRPSAMARDIGNTCDGREPRTQFRDVPASSPHRAAIDCLSAHEITQGKGDGEFAPNETVSVGQLATFLVRTLEQAGHTLTKTDLEENWCRSGAHADAMTKVKNAGLLTPQCDDHVHNATREMMATAIANAMALAGVPMPEGTPDAFYDDEHHSNAKHDEQPRLRVDVAAAMGVITGDGRGMLAPHRPVSRAQMASFLIRALDAIKAS